MQLPEKAKFNFAGKVVALGSVSALPALEVNPQSVGLPVHVCDLEERGLKGWALNAELLADGWTSLGSGFVNMAHKPRELWGYVTACVQENGGIYANLAISRAKLAAENMDPTRLPQDFAVSVEWIYDVEQSVVVKGEERMSLQDAAALNMLTVNSTPSGLPEIVLNDADATLYPGGVQFGDIALVPLSNSKPVFPSARIMAAVAAQQVLQYSDSVDVFLSKVDSALSAAYSFIDPEGYPCYPWILALFTEQVGGVNGVIFRQSTWDQATGWSSNTWFCTYTVAEDGTITVGEKVATEVDEQFIVASTNSVQAMMTRYDGLVSARNAKSKEVTGMAIRLNKDSYAKEEVEALLTRASDEAAAAATAAVTNPESDLYKAFEAHFTETKVPAITAQVKAEVSQALAAQADALDKLNAIKALSDEDKATVLASMEKGEFSLPLAIAERKVAVYEAEKAEAAAAAATTTTTPAAETAPVKDEAAERLATAAAAWNSVGSGTEAVAPAAPAGEPTVQPKPANKVPLIAG